MPRVALRSTVGTDIQDNKCSWNINIALAHATSEQRAVLDAHYGQRSAESEERVKEVFRAENIDVEKRFKEYEKESHARIEKMIMDMPENVGAKEDGSNGLKREVFRSFLEKVSRAPVPSFTLDA